VRYRAAVGVGEEAHSRQRHWCPWSKPVNVETWGHVPYPVVMAHAFAELRYGIVARQHENGFKCGGTFPLRPFSLLRTNHSKAQLRGIQIFAKIVY
jgi:hypothetical protein